MGHSAMTVTNTPERRFIHRFCQGYMDRLREILKANPPKDSPCSSCAFVIKTDRWVGFMSTCWQLMQAATGGRPFYCHRNMPKVNGNYKPDLAKMIPCANYEAIRHCEKEMDQALREAAAESEPLDESTGR